MYRRAPLTPHPSPQQHKYCCYCQPRKHAKNPYCDCTSNPTAVNPDPNRAPSTSNTQTPQLLLAPRTNIKTTSGKIARQWCRRAFLDGKMKPLLHLQGIQAGAAASNRSDGKGRSTGDAPVAAAGAVVAGAVAGAGAAAGAAADGTAAPQVRAYHPTLACLMSWALVLYLAVHLWCHPHNTRPLNSRATRLPQTKSPRPPP